MPEHIIKLIQTKTKPIHKKLINIIILIYFYPYKPGTKVARRKARPMANRLSRMPRRRLIRTRRSWPARGGTSKRRWTSWRATRRLRRSMQWCRRSARSCRPRRHSWGLRVLLMTRSSTWRRRRLPSRSRGRSSRRPPPCTRSPLCSGQSAEGSPGRIRHNNTLAKPFLQLFVHIQPLKHKNM